MLIGFEDITKPLSKEEIDVHVPQICATLRLAIGKDMAISNKRLCEMHGLKDARVRAMINHIRHNALIGGLIASRHGYYISTDAAEVRNYLRSLNQRCSAISATRNSFLMYLNSLESKGASV